MDSIIPNINEYTLKTISVTAQQLIRKHLSLVLQANETTNLTRITSLPDALVLHVEDALSATPEFERAPCGLYGDLGTGGGFPGIPLSIVSGRQTILIESVQKKAAILERIVGSLGLSEQISIYAGRIEEMSLHQPESFSVLTARALSSLPTLLELSSPLLALKGQLICFKAQLEDAELEHAIALCDKLGMALYSDRELMLSDGKTARRILVFEKRAEPRIQLPRRTGIAQKRPLKA